MDQKKGDICPNCFYHSYINGQCIRCGYHIMGDSHISSRILQAGTLLQQRYHLGRVLGEGGFGITYKVYDTRKNRICAIKEYAPNGQFRRGADKKTMEIVSSAANGPYMAGLKRFMEESQILSRLENIPSVVDIWESFQENATAYLVMEYLDGADLGQIVRDRRRSLSVGEVTDIILQVALSMDIIHTQTGIIHRDISPDNICITKDQKVKLIDFGSAKEVSGIREDFSVLVRLKFSPPEQYYPNMAQGSFTDVYSLAATYYYALAKLNLPPAGERLNGQNYVPLKQLGLGMKESVSDAVDRALLLDVKKRTQTMQEFIQGIIPAARGREKREVPYVAVITGPLSGRSWTMASGQRVKVGRSARDADLRIECPEDISRIHCEITYKPDKKMFRIRDISTYGVFYNGRRLEKGREYSFFPPARFMLASRACIIEVGVKYEYH